MSCKSVKHSNIFRQIRNISTFSGESQKHFQMKHRNIPAFSEKSEIFQHFQAKQKHFNIFRQIRNISTFSGESQKHFQGNHRNISTFSEKSEIFQHFQANQKHFNIFRRITETFSGE
jgi:hypothetical protein